MKNKLPKQDSVSLIDLFDCDSITQGTVPINGKTDYFQGKNCNATIGKTRILKSEQSNISKANIFCGTMFKPQIENISKLKEKELEQEYIKRYGTEKGRFYYQNELLSYEGKEGGRTCLVAMKIDLPEGTDYKTYETKKLYVRKPRG